MPVSRVHAFLAGAALVLTSCGGNSSPGTPSPAATPPPSPTPASLFTAPALEALTAGEVQRIVAQAAGEATARSRPAVIAVVDRVGNVLAVFTMTGANTGLAVPEVPGQEFDLQGVSVPGGAVAGAIAKAITGAYLSSGGNAFTTRTASQIVQEHFPPAPGVTNGLESGPLFGVQFSQLPCSDLSARFGAAGGAALIGPKRSPLGLSADAGGLPLYKNGVIVGGIGVMADGVYGFDPDIRDVDADDEEFIAVAGTQGFAAPDAIRANRITVDGTSLRYADATEAGLRSNPGSPPAFAALAGSLTSVNGYFDAAGGVRAGVAYGTEASGIRRSTPAEFANQDAFILTDGSGANRFPIRGGTDAGSVASPLSAAEVRAILEEAFLILSRARAQIRQPLDSRMQASISVVDTNGEVLGLVRSPDAPIFGTDVSLQKARTAAFFSNGQAAAQLLGNPSADVRAFVAATRTFLADPNALTGSFAFTNRSVGNIARPPGPLSRPIASFSPFSTGLQSALILGDVLTHVGFILGANPDAPPRCTATPDAVPGQNRLENGIQIFPGSVAIYRGSTLVGGIGVSGDGIDQDDMVAFLGLSNGGARVGTVGNAPAGVRSDRIVVAVGPQGTRLRYVGCPFAPFLDTAQQNVCQGL